jgi:hypothetical protein
MNQCPPGPQVCHLSLFEFLSKIRRDIRMFITGVNDTGDKLFSGVNDTGEKFIAGNNDTGDKFIAGDKNKDAMEVGSCQG